MGAMINNSLPPQGSVQDYHKRYFPDTYPLTLDGRTTHHSRYPLAEDDEPVHRFFSLSYSSYLVLPRTLLQSAPLEWQRKFIECIEELGEMFDHQKDTYNVTLRENGKFAHDPLANYERGRRQEPIKAKFLEDIVP